NPNSQRAVENLLVLKQRPLEKGLILVAPDLDLLLPFIDESKLQPKHWQCLQAQYDHPISWVVPAKATTATFLTGKFKSIAIRLCRHEAVKLICEQTGFALTSTSANLSGLPPCKTSEQVKLQFGEHFPVLDMPVGNAAKPSEIRDLLTEQLFRQG
ncbi:MAG TPA: tRNA threonylcarbamoyladenosine biosynthesis protein RimN, partial [Pasteurellaceae bacterium]|nr:tRNA threonylcarbamoyladenosine biosynthesis protein RimN [Pasteurellaceae bacterium]